MNTYTFVVIPFDGKPFEIKAEFRETQQAMEFAAQPRIFAHPEPNGDLAFYYPHAIKKVVLKHQVAAASPIIVPN